MSDTNPRDINDTIGKNNDKILKSKKKMMIILKSENRIVFKLNFIGVS